MLPSNTKEEERTSINYQLYVHDKEFKVDSNLENYVIEAQNFYNGFQYPDDNPDNMVRVTMNICSFSSNIKASKIVGTNRYITFTADSTDYDCKKLQLFDEYNVKKLDEKTEDFQTCLDAFNNGTAIINYVWDKDDTTYKGIYKGGLRMHHIDILKFAVANPYESDLQRQRWVMYWNDEDISAIRDLVKRKNKKTAEYVKECIVPDNYDDNADKQTHVMHGLARVWTRYFRVRGEVCFMCSTRNVDLFEYPQFLNPKVNASLKRYAKKLVEQFNKEQSLDEVQPSFDKVKDLQIDYENIVSQVYDAEVMSDKDYQKGKEKFSLYPFAKYVPFTINGSFYGRSDIKDLIPTQKGLNFAYSMVLVCMQNNAYNKILVKDGALEGQEITNEAGQVITDYSRMTNQWGIKPLESQPLPNGVIDFADRMLQMTRVVHGFNDVMDGSVSNQDISGYAVQQMIKQANSSIEQQQQLFWKFCKDKAEIRLMFYKHYVDSARYTYELEDYQVQDSERKRMMLQKRQADLQAQGKELEIGKVDLSKPTTKVQVKDFKGSEIWGVNFDIDIEIVQGLADSELAESQMWDTLIMNGNIQNLSPEMLELYLEANPTISQRSKATLKHIVEKQKMEENTMLKQKLQEATGYIQQLLKLNGQLQAQNGYTQNYLKNLEKEFTNKIGAANKTIKAQNDFIAQKQQATEGEAKSNNSRGVGGSDIVSPQ